MCNVFINMGDEYACMEYLCNDESILVFVLNTIKVVFVMIMTIAWVLKRKNRIEVLINVKGKSLYVGHIIESKCMLDGFLPMKSNMVGR